MKRLLRYAVIMIGVLGVLRAVEVNESVGARIDVKVDGTIYFDDRRVEFAELDRLLTPIQEKRGVVWFRFVPLRGGRGLSPIALNVANLLATKRISVRPYPRDDFPLYPENRATPSQLRQKLRAVW